MEFFLWNKHKIPVKTKFSCPKNILEKILKSLIINIDFESWNYCIFRRHKLLGQTTKHPLSNFKPKKYWKYKQLWGLRPDLLINKNKCIAKLWEKQLKKKLRNKSASLLKISLWNSYQLLRLQINHLISA